MARGTPIEWTDVTWNPVTGCTKLSPGCDHCYAERFAERWRGTPGHPYEQGFELKLWPARLEHPRKWKRPQRIFVNSMSDLFHKKVPRGFIDRVFDVMESVDRHTYQVLTKRSTLMRAYILDRYAGGPPPAHIWLGVSVEDRARRKRISHLQDTAAAVRFVSFEPLIGPVGRVNLDGIQWLIVGGESGPRARPMREEWALELLGQCKSYRASFFFKQWGGRRPTSGGRLLAARTWNEFPHRPLRVDPENMLHSFTCALCGRTHLQLDHQEICFNCRQRRNPSISGVSF